MVIFFQGFFQEILPCFFLLSHNFMVLAIFYHTMKIIQARFLLCSRVGTPSRAPYQGSPCPFAAACAATYYLLMVSWCWNFFFWVLFEKLKICSGRLTFGFFFRSTYLWHFPWCKKEIWIYSTCITGKIIHCPKKIGFKVHVLP